jgi:hypothetical protein
MSMKTKNVPIYETSDFHLAVVLCSLGAQIVSIESSVGDRCIFLFEQTRELQATIDAYWRKLLSIEPQSLFAAQRSLKSRLNENRYGSK